MTMASLASTLQDTAKHELTQFIEIANNVPLTWPTNPSFNTHIEKLFCCSLFALQFATRYPEILLSDLAQKMLYQPCGLEDYRENIKNIIQQSSSETALFKNLRIYRQQEMIRLAFRDLNNLAETTEILVNLSELAEAFIDLTLEYSYEQIALKFGYPKAPSGKQLKPIVLGMGKLGGMELNYSSDIDLIFAYVEGGKADGRKELDVSDFYRRMIALFVRILNDKTADGFIYRVDLRLRPFGASGPVAMSFDALETYYLTQGREWERYAMIKARVVSGDKTDAEDINIFLRPFIFRRYLDFSAFDSLRELKTKIASEVNRKGMEDNIKLGSGGIREIEFIGQAFQLVRGGKEPELQQRGIVTILKLLAEKQYLTQDESTDLLSAYNFLRRCENRLQMLQDRQTHVLPDADIEKSRLAYAMDFEDYPAFLAVLDKHRYRVAEIFEDVFKLEGESPSDNADDLSTWRITLDASESIQVLKTLGFKDADECQKQLAALLEGSQYSRLSNTARQRLKTITPDIITISSEAEDPDETLHRMLHLIRKIAGRSVYIQVLIERPQALARLVRLFSASHWLFEFVSSHPLVIDELLDHRLDSEITSYPELAQQMQAIIARVKDEGLDIQLDAVREFKQANLMRIITADLEGIINLKQVSDQLSHIASLVLEGSTQLVWSNLTKKHGKPSMMVDGTKQHPEFAIVAYGKLGGLELGYGSDLDIVFLHDSQGEQQQTDGKSCIDNALFFARMAQRTTAFLTTFTTAGTLYEIDTRLRPNGQSGMLVSSVTAYEHYQLTNAWVWEHQALVRARIVVGSPKIQQAFDLVRKKVLAQTRDKPELQKEVRDMRERMHSELNKAREGQFDAKHSRGGMVDIEFMVQYTVLAFASSHQNLLQWTDNVRMLEMIAESGYLSQIETEELTGIYLHLRHLSHQQALQGIKKPLPIDSQWEANSVIVQNAWKKLLV